MPASDATRVTPSIGRGGAADPQRHARRQLRVQLLQAREQQPALHGAGDAERHDVGPPRRRGRGEVGQRHLHSERKAGATLQRHHGLGHQQAQAMRLAGQRGQQHARRTGGCRQRMQRRVQCHAHALGVQVLLEHAQLAAHPGLAHAAGQRRNDVHDKRPQTMARLDHREALLQRRGVVAAYRVEQRCELGLARGLWACRVPGGSAQRAQFVEAARHDAPGAVPGVHQPLDDLQLRDLRRRVDALAEGVATRLREAVAALPHPQGVLAQAGVAFHLRDGQGDRHDCVCL